MYDTPSGSNKTALDKFVLHYTSKGYNWTDRATASYTKPQTELETLIQDNILKITQIDSDIIFYKNNDILVALAQIENKKITGFKINKITLIS